jgi:hypothetical protein
MTTEPSPAPPAGTPPRASHKKLLWFLMLALLAVLAVGAVAWKPLDLAWCRRQTQTRGLDRLGRIHIRKGADRAKVERVLASVGLVMRHAPDQSFGGMDRYVIGFADPDHPRFMFWALVQIEDGKFAGISTCH